MKVLYGPTLLFSATSDCFSLLDLTQEGRSRTSLKRPLKKWMKTGATFIFSSRRRALGLHGVTLVYLFVERIRKRRLTQTYYIPKWSSDQARLHAGVSGPLPPTSPTPGAPTSFTPPSRASGTLLYGNNKHKNDPLTLFFKNRQTLLKGWDWAHLRELHVKLT